MTSEERLQQARASVAKLNMPLKKDTDCQYFIESECSKGEQCGFRHQEMAKKNTVCIPWMQSQCKKGVQCFFQHPSLFDSFNSYGGGYPSLHVGAVDRSTTPCYYFKNGTCAKGATCSFLHPGGETPAGLNTVNAPDNNRQGSTGGGAFGGGGFGPPPGVYPPASFGSTSRGPNPTFGNSSFNAPPMSLLGSSHGNAGFANSPFARSPFSNPQHMAPPRGTAQASASDRRTETYPSEATSTVKDKLGFASTNTRLDPKANLRPKGERGVERERERTVGAKHEREPNRTHPPAVSAVRPERVRSIHPTRASAIHGVGLFSRGISEALNNSARQAPPQRQATTTRHTPSATAPTLTRKVQSTGDVISITTPMRRPQESQKQRQNTAEMAEKAPQQGAKRVVERTFRAHSPSGVESGGAAETKPRSMAKPQSPQKQSQLQAEGAGPRFGKAAAARAKQLLEEANKGEEEMDSSSSAPKQQVKAAPQPEKRKAEPASGSPLVRSVSNSDVPAETARPVVQKFDGPKTFEQIMEEKRKRQVEAPTPGASEAAKSASAPPVKKSKASPAPAEAPPKMGLAAPKRAAPGQKAAPAVVTKQRPPSTQTTVPLPIGMAPMAPIGAPGNPTTSAGAAQGGERTEEAAADYNAEEDEFDAGDEGLEEEGQEEEEQEVEDYMDDDIAEALAFDF